MSAPLAERMRPRDLDEIVGQRRLLAPSAALRRALEAGRVHSMILWGPPGCGKTTLTRLIASHAEARFLALPAVMSGLPEVRRILGEERPRPSPAASAPCCSWTRCTASTGRNRTPSCRTSRPGTSSSSGRPPKTRVSS